MKKTFNDRWLSLSGDAGDSYVRYSDISMFVCSEIDRKIKIFIKGSDTPVIFGYSDIAELNGTRKLLIEHL